MRADVHTDSLFRDTDVSHAGSRRRVASRRNQSQQLEMAQCRIHPLGDGVQIERNVGKKTVGSNLLQKGGCQRGKADTLQQALKTWIFSQGVHAWIHVKIDKPVAMLFVRFLQVFNRAVVFP
jgi:hypothetical protein